MDLVDFSKVYLKIIVPCCSSSCCLSLYSRAVGSINLHYRRSYRRIGPSVILRDNRVSPWVEGVVKCEDIGRYFIIFFLAFDHYAGRTL